VSVSTSADSGRRRSRGCDLADAHRNRRGPRLGRRGSALTEALAVGGTGLASDEPLTRAGTDRGLAGDAGLRRERRLRARSDRAPAGCQEAKKAKETKSVTHTDHTFSSVNERLSENGCNTQPSGGV
jgi:hypothetical protein